MVQCIVDTFFVILMLFVSWWQRDRAAWLMHPKDCFVDAVAENLLDRLEVEISIYCLFGCSPCSAVFLWLVQLCFCVIVILLCL